MHEAFPSAARSNAMDLEQSSARFLSLVERKERLAERSAFGLLALHAGSIVALFSAWSSLSDLGVTKDSAGFLLAMMLVGMGCAIASIRYETDHVTIMGGEEFRRLTHFRITEALLQLRADTDTMDRLGQQIATLDSVRPKDFEYSPPAMWLVNTSGGLWIGAASAVIYQVAVHLLGCG